MFCPNCGAKIDGEQKFCNRCGKNLKNTSRLDQSSFSTQTPPLEKSIDDVIPSYIKSNTPSKPEQNSDTFSWPENKPKSKSTALDQPESTATMIMGTLSLVLFVIGLLLTFFWVYGKTDPLQELLSNPYSLLFFGYGFPYPSTSSSFVYKPSNFQLSVPLMCFIIGLVLGIIGLVMARKAKMDELENPKQQTGKITGIIGIITNSIATTLYIIDAYLRFYLNQRLYDYLFASGVVIVVIVFFFFACCTRRRRY
ncbi:MAG: membrane protein of unknown function [Promethearchaeota archaeon]|nr:MAG: membrane protein of unknown function [Candidatus Lokiarchaeota archaeon]